MGEFSCVAEGSKGKAVYPSGLKSRDEPLPHWKTKNIQSINTDIFGASMNIKAISIYLSIFPFFYLYIH